MYAKQHFVLALRPLRYVVLLFASIRTVFGWDLINGGDHLGQDWTVVGNQVVAGVHWNIGVFRGDGSTQILSVKPLKDGSNFGVLEISARRIIIGPLMTISADQAGYGGGGGGGGGGGADAARPSGAPGTGGAAGGASSVAGGLPGKAGVTATADGSGAAGSSGGRGGGPFYGSPGAGRSGNATSSQIEGGDGNDGGYLAAASNGDGTSDETVSMGSGGGGGGGGAGGDSTGTSSGGGGGGGGGAGGSGGGIIRLIASEALQIQGRLTSRGGNGQPGSVGGAGKQFKSGVNEGPAGNGGPGGAATISGDGSGGGGGDGACDFGTANCSGKGGRGGSGGGGGGGGILLKAPVVDFSGLVAGPNVAGGGSKNFGTVKVFTGPSGQISGPPAVLGKFTPGAFPKALPAPTVFVPDASHPFLVAITENSGVGSDYVLVRYTTNNSDPSATSTRYLAPFTVPPNSIVRAKAFAVSGGWDPSPQASLAVQKAILTARAVDTTRVYGAVNPAFEVQYTGFLNGDGPRVLDAAPSISTSATVQSDIGDYPINLNGGSDDVYDFNLVPGLLKIDRAEILVSANDSSRPYGTSNPQFGFKLSGFVNSDSQGVVTGLPDLTSAAVAASSVGTYAIVPAQGSLAARNYRFSFKAGTLTILKADQKINFPEISDATLGQSPIDLAATASSGLPIQYSVVSGGATVENGRLRITGGGQVQVRASQSGNGNYNAAIDVTNSLTAFLTLNAVATTGGTVSVDPSQARYAFGSKIRLTAIPSGFPGQFVFKGWSGAIAGAENPISLVLKDNATVTANFLPTFTLGLLTNGNGGIEVSPVRARYESNEVVTLRAVPGVNQIFTGWSGVTSADGTNALVVMNSDTIVRAGFRSPTYSLSSSTASVRENEGTFSILVVRDPPGAGSVSYSTVDVAAIAGRDYGAASGKLNFGEKQESAEIRVPILNNLVPDGDRRRDFQIKLTSPGIGQILGAQSSTVVTIIDDDGGRDTNSFPQLAVPNPRPDSLSSLKVVFDPAVNGMGWRFPWENTWRSPGDIASNLDPGDYDVEFRPVAQFEVPPRISYSLAPGAFVTRTNHYERNPLSVGANLQVKWEPIELLNGGWRLAGESAFRANGAIALNVPMGVQVIEFKGVDDWERPAFREVEIGPLGTAEVEAIYRYAPRLIAKATPVPLANYEAIRNGPTLTPSTPYPVVGQLRSQAGYGSGIAVLDHVVLTAAHLLFEPDSTNFVRWLNWFPSRHEGALGYEPRPIAAAGWYIHTNYIVARSRELAKGLRPGESTVDSQQWDVAAVFFNEPAARGGASGYLMSDLDNNPWLNAGQQATLLGYPLGVDADGKMHAVPGGRYHFGPVTGPAVVGGRVFGSEDFVSYPGNSGGPWCVVSDNTYFPAGVYLGSSGGQSVVRAIDRDAVALILRAASSAAVGTNFTGGGVIVLNTALSGASAFAEQTLTVRIEPAAAVDAGAGWKVTQRPSFSSSGTESSIRLLAGYDYTIEFKPAKGYLSPTNYPVRMIAGQNLTLLATYSDASNPGGVTLSSPTLTSQGMSVRIEGPGGSRFRIESTLDLVKWSSVVTNEAPATVVLPVNQNDRTRYFRAVPVSP